jgi:hypothetical protein
MAATVIRGSAVTRKLAALSRRRRSIASSHFCSLQKRAISAYRKLSAGIPSTLQKMQLTGGNPCASLESLQVLQHDTSS